MFNLLINFIREQFKTNDFIPLHAPIFIGKERKFICDAIDSTFVSSVGAYVDQFERDMMAYTNSPSAVVTVNGTSALHIALKLAGVKNGDYVITQSLTFIATCNAITYCNAEPIFIDVEKNSLSLSPYEIDNWLNEFAYIDDDGLCRFRNKGKIIRACLPMHTFGHPANLDDLIEVCNKWNLVLVEDAAESLGSLYKNKHTGTFGKLGILSFNGNKIITTGGGGMILTNETLGKRAKHLTTTAKVPDDFHFIHDEIGYNYRLPNINAAIGCAQLELLEYFVSCKRSLASAYQDFFEHSSFKFISEPDNCRSNYWLNAVLCEDKKQRDELLCKTKEAHIMTRPVWGLMHQLPMFQHGALANLSRSEWLADRLVNLPSSVIMEHDCMHRIDINHIKY